MLVTQSGKMVEQIKIKLSCMVVAYILGCPRLTHKVLIRRKKTDFCGRKK